MPEHLNMEAAALLQLTVFAYRRGDLDQEDRELLDDWVIRLDALRDSLQRLPVCDSVARQI